ncbi:MAG: SEC-C metal-binding domain-containing protein [Planctomycetota bacterium]
MKNSECPLTTCELIDSLRQYPDGVLPAGVLRELIQRGPSIREPLLRRLDEIAESAGSGIGSVPGEAFFCFGLLLACPSKEQLPTLERLLRLDWDHFDEIGGDLTYDIPNLLLAEIARRDGGDMVMQWVARIIADESMHENARSFLLPSLPYMVHNGSLQRQEAIDYLTTLLRKRENCNYDQLSTYALIELSNLEAGEQDGLVRACFDRKQIDDSIFAPADWERESACFATPDSPSASPRPLELDFLERIKWWHGFPEICESLDPFGPAEPNPNRHVSSFTKAPLSAADIDGYLRALSSSNDENFPGEAVRKLVAAMDQVQEHLIEELRQGLLRAGGPEARSNNSAFLAFVLLVAQTRRIPQDILLGFIDLSDESRFDLLGDSVGLLLVIALATSLQGNAAPIVERILDPERDELDRSLLTMFFPCSARLGNLTRTEAIDAMIALHKKLLLEPACPELVSSSMLECLCIMSPQSHRDSLLQSIEQVQGGMHFDQRQLRELLDDPQRGEEHVEKIYRETRDYMGQIQSSVMFDEEALGKKPVVRPTKLAQPQLIAEPMPLDTNITIRNTTATPGRNDACSCGSGRKYKKCCMRKIS